VFSVPLVIQNPDVKKLNLDFAFFRIDDSSLLFLAPFSDFPPFPLTIRVAISPIFSASLSNANCSEEQADNSSVNYVNSDDEASVKIRERPSDNVVDDFSVRKANPR
jgi:hypothetical protein